MADELHLTYLNRPDVEALGLTDEEILDAVEGGLRAQGLGETVIEPRVHLRPDESFRGHFNVLRGYIAPLALAGVKVVGDYVDNYQRGLPSENGLLTLYDPRTGVPQAVIDAAGLTDMRTGAVTALGARAARPAGIARARPHRRARHGLLERAPARPPVRARRDPRPLAAAREPRGLRARSWSATSGGRSSSRRLGVGRARRRHRRRGARLERPEPLLRTGGSSPARWSCPTAR